MLNRDLYLVRRVHPHAYACTAPAHPTLPFFRFPPLCIFVVYLLEGNCLTSPFLLVLNGLHTRHVHTTGHMRHPSPMPVRREARGRAASCWYSPACLCKRSVRPPPLPLLPPHLPSLLRADRLRQALRGHGFGGGWRWGMTRHFPSDFSRLGASRPHLTHAHLQSHRLLSPSDSLSPPVRPAILSEDASRPFWPSSPSNGPLVDNGTFYGPPETATLPRAQKSLSPQEYARLMPGFVLGVCPRRAFACLSPFPSPSRFLSQEASDVHMLEDRQMGEKRWDHGEEVAVWPHRRRTNQITRGKEGKGRGGCSFGQSQRASGAMEGNALTGHAGAGAGVRSAAVGQRAGPEVRRRALLQLR